MPRQSFWTPLSLLIAGLVVIAILLAGPHMRTDAQPPLDNYPPPTATAKAALAQTETATARAKYPGPGNATATPTTSPGDAATATATATSEGGSQQTPDTFAPSDTPETPSDQPEAPTDTPEDTSAPTATPTPSDMLTCAPGEPILISGQGPPRAPFLLYFGQRAVSGGSVEPDGSFAITLLVGSERAGTYTVTVRVRGSTQVLRQLTCTVPPTTPTPLPTARASAIQ